MIGGVPVHVGGVLYSGHTGGDFVWSREVGPVRGHGENDSGGPHRVFTAGDR